MKYPLRADDTQGDDYIPASTVSAHLFVFRARWAVAAAGQAAGVWAEALLRLGFLVLLGQAKRTEEIELDSSVTQGIIINPCKLTRLFL